MKLVFNKLSFIRPTFLLTLSNACSYSITFLFSLFIAKFYQSGNFGQYTLVVTVSAFLSPILTKTNELLLVSEKNDEIAINLARSTIRTASQKTLGLFIFLIIIQILNIFFSLGFSDSFLKILLLTIGLSYINALFNVTLQMSIRLELFTLIALRILMQSLLIASFQLFFYTINIQSLGLVLGECVGRTLSVASFVVLFKRQTPMQKHAHKELKPRESSEKYNLPAILIELACPVFIVIFIASQYGNSFLGIYGMWQKILYAPISLIGAAYSQVMLARLSSEYNQLHYISKITWKKYTRQLVTLGVILAIFLWVLSPLITKYILGPDWYEINVLMQISQIPFLIAFLWNPLSVIFYAKKMWKSHFVFTLTRFISTITTIIICLKIELDFISFCFATIISLSIVQIIGIVFLRSRIK